MAGSSKVRSPRAAARLAASARRRKGKVVFTNGCFDLIHVGHIRYLRRARALGDLLIVGVNSDASLRRIKGSTRPIVPHVERAEIISALECVDCVTLFEEEDPLELIQAIRPDILVKGGDWPEDQIVGADFVKEQGGKVVRIPLVPGASTTSIIERILTHYRVLTP